MKFSQNKTVITDWSSIPQLTTSKQSYKVDK